MQYYFSVVNCCFSQSNFMYFLYVGFKNGRIMPWQCPCARPSIRLSFRLSVRVFRTCFQHDLRYQFETWFKCLVGGTICRAWVIGSLWPTLQPKVYQTHFLQSWPHKSSEILQIWYLGSVCDFIMFSGLFLHVLRCRFATCYIHLVGGATHQVWVSCNGHDTMQHSTFTSVMTRHWIFGFLW